MQVGSPVFPPQQPGLDVPLLLFTFLGWNRGRSLRSPTCHVAAGLMVVQGPPQPWQLLSARRGAVVCAPVGQKSQATNRKN